MRLKSKNIVLIILLLCIAVTLGASFLEITRVPGLLGYDGYYWMHLSEEAAETGISPRYDINSYTPEEPLIYPSGLTTLMAVLQLSTGVSPVSLYKFFGPMCLALLLLCMFLLLRHITGNRLISVFGVLMLACNRLLLYRSAYGGLPEAFALPFEILGVYFMIRGRPGWLAISLCAAFCFHYQSALILLALVGIYYLPQVLHKENYNFKPILKLSVLTALFIILLLPILGELAARYSDVLPWYTTQEGSWWLNEPSPERYNPLSLSEYIGEIGNIIPFLLLPFGLIFLLKSQMDSKVKVLLIFWLIITFIPTQSLNVGITMLPTRFLLYFSLPLTIISCIGLKGLLASRSKSKKWLLGMSVTLPMIFILFFNSIHYPSFQGFYPSDFEARQWLEENAIDAVIITPATVGVDFLPENKNEARYEMYIDVEILRCSRTSEVNRILKREYGENEQVYFYVVSSRRSDLNKRFPGWEELLANYLMVFCYNNTGIYRLQ